MKRNKSEEGGGDWQGTYGDMVTLLLCFFIMLYAMSNVDQEKWRQVVISLNPHAVEQVNHYEGAGDKAGDIPVDVPVDNPPDEFDELYLSLVQVIEDLDLQAQVEVKKGVDYTYLNMNDQVFFDGDNSYLRPEAKIVLDKVSEVFAQSNEYIGEIYIMGHTSQATPERKNNPRNDRTLSALRAMEVTVYIQEKNIISPDKLIDVSFGQFRPISSIDTRDGRAKNRRVEILLTKEGTALIPLQEIYKDMYGEDVGGGAGAAVEDAASLGQDEPNGTNRAGTASGSTAARPADSAGAAGSSEAAAVRESSAGETENAPEENTDSENTTP